MKYLYLLLGIIGLVVILVLYFQLYAGASVYVPFFTKWIEIRPRTSTILVAAFLSGVFMALGVKSFISWSNKYDDDFDL